MNKKTNKTSNEPHSNASCLGQGLGMLVRDLLKTLGPPPEARRHFAAARIEVLRGVRALVDARIERLSQPRSKGEKIPVE